MKYFVLIFAVTLCSCGNDASQSNVPPKEVRMDTLTHDHQRYDRQVDIVKYDGCEYLIVNAVSNSAWGTHKGNCKNPEHKR